MIGPPLQNQRGWRFASRLSHATSLLFLCPSSKTSHRKPPPYTQHESHPLPLAHIVLSPRHGISTHHRQAPFQRHCSSMAQSCPALGNSDFAQVHNPVHHSRHIPPPRFSSTSVHEPLPRFQDEYANPFAGRTDGCSNSCQDKRASQNYTSSGTETKASASFSSRIAKFAIMLDVAIFYLAFRSRAQYP